jgi:gp36
MVNSDKENFNEEEIVVDMKRIITMKNSEKTWVIDGYLWLHCPVCGNEVMDIFVMSAIGRTLES